MLEALSVDGDVDVALVVGDGFVALGVGDGFVALRGLGVAPTEHNVPPHCAQSCPNATFDGRPSVELCTRKTCSSNSGHVKPNVVPAYRVARSTFVPEASNTKGRDRVSSEKAMVTCSLFSRWTSTFHTEKFIIRRG